MVKLARIKDFEDIPDREKCCAFAIAGIKKWAGKVIEVESFNKPDLVQRCVCGSEHKGLHWRQVDDIRNGYPADCLDIDEG